LAPHSDADYLIDGAAMRTPTGAPEISTFGGKSLTLRNNPAYSYTDWSSNSSRNGGPLAIKSSAGSTLTINDLRLESFGAQAMIKHDFGSTGTFTLAGNITLVTGTGRILLLVGAPQVTFTIASNISGSGGLWLDNFDGASATNLFALTGANTYTGVTWLTGGTSFANGVTLHLDSDTALGNTRALKLDSAAATLDLNGHNATAGALTGTFASSLITNKAAATLATATVTTASADTTYADRLADGDGALALVKNGAGALTLTGTAAYSGPTTVNAGALVIATTNFTSTGALTLSAGTLANTTATALSTRSLDITAATGLLTSASTHGVTIRAGGTVSNAGTIRTTANIQNITAINAPGSIYITNSGLIDSTSRYGILTAATGILTLKNSGTIRFTDATRSGAAVSISNTFNINNTGLIDSANFGLRILAAATATGTLANSDTIIGGDGSISLNTGTALILLNQNAGLITSSSANAIIAYITITATNAGLISGHSFDFRTLDATVTGTLINSGTIIGTGSTAAAISLSTSDTITLINQNTGLITSSSANAIIAYHTISATNADLISGSGGAGITFQGTQGSGVGAGSNIHNTGTIAGTGGAAINAITSILITNTGAGALIASTATGNAATAVNLPVGGTIRNAGQLILTGAGNNNSVISAADGVLDLASTGLIGAVTGSARYGVLTGTNATLLFDNSGTILTANAYNSTEGVRASAAFTATNSGLISGNYGFRTYDATATGTLFNTGTIQGRTNIAISLESGHDILIGNAAGAQITGDTTNAIITNIAAQITNAGRIDGATNAININAGAANTTITNTGTNTGTGATAAAIHSAAPRRPHRQHRPRRPHPRRRRRHQPHRRRHHSQRRHHHRQHHRHAPHTR
jgi:autotransporter-associated beta strand protein